MKQNTILHASARLLGILAVILLTGLTAWANVVTWTGTGASANWNDTGNWASLAVPVAGDSLVFQGSTQLENTNDLPSLSISALTYDNGDFITWWPGITNVPMASTNVITVTGGITNVAGNNQIHNTIALGGAAPIVSQTAANTLTLSGGLTLGANQGLWEGDGDHTLTGPLTGTGNPALVKQGTGTLNLNNQNSYSGTLFVNAGTVSLPDGWTSPSLVGNVSVASNATLAFSSHPYSYGTVNWTTNAGTITASSDCHVPNLIMVGGATVTGGGGLRVGNYYGTGGNYISKASSLTNSITCGYLNLYATGNFIVEKGTGTTVDLVIPATIGQSGVHGLTKTGAGTLELSGNCTYSGNTLINAGTVILTGSGLIGSSALISLATNTFFDVSAASPTWGLYPTQTLAGAGVVLGDVNDLGQIETYIAPGGTLSASTLTFSNTVTLNGGIQLKLDLASSTTVGGGVNDLLFITNLVANGQTIVDFSFLNGQPVNGGTYTLIQYQTFTGSGNIADNFVNAPSAYSYTFINDTVNKAIKVTVTGTPTSLTWQGDGANNFWDINATADWLNGAVNTVYLDGNIVTFDNTGSATPNINIQSQVQPVAVNVTGTQNYTFDGVGYLGGGASMNKSGSGTLTFLTPNSFTGPMSISGGTVLVGTNSTLGALGTGYTTNNGQLVFNRSDTYAFTGTVVGNNGVTISNGTVQLGNNGTSGNILTPITNYATLTVVRSDTPTVPGPIVGTGTINLPGGSSARFNNINTSSMLGLGTSGGVAANLVVGSGDSITVKDLYTGQGGGNLGNITQTGGTINVTDSTDGEGPLRLGHWSGGPSYYNMSGGVLYITNGASSRFSIGIDGNGIWNVSGGVANVNRVDVNGRNATGGGTLNLTNGTINVGPGGIYGNAPYSMNLLGGTLGALSSWSCGITGTLATAGSQVAFDTSTNTITYSGVLTGPGGLVKQGAGTLALTCPTNTYTGTTTISNGILAATSFVGPVVVQSNGTLSAGAVLTPATLGITNNLTLNGGAALTFDLGNTNTLGGGVNDLIVVQTNLILSGSIPVTLNFLGFPYTAGPYVLITNVGSQVGSATFFATNNQTRYTAAFSTTPHVIQVSLSGTGANLVWKGDGSANLWNVVGSANWLSGASPAQFYQADSVTFDDSTANTTVNLSGSLNPITTTVSITNNSYLLAGTGKISGPTGITKNGPNTLTIATDNDFIGPMNVNAGTLQIGNGGGTGSIATTLMTNNATMIYNRTNAQTVSAYNTRGTGVILKENTNTLTLGIAQALSGGITVNRGVLRWTAGVFGGQMTPTMTINTNGTMLTDTTHAPGGTTPLFINRGTWLQNYEDYKGTLTMVDGLIAPGGGGNGGDLRVGTGGGAGSWTWTVSNSIAGSVINEKLNTIRADATLTLNVLRGAAASDLTINGMVYNLGNIMVSGNGITTLTCPSNSVSGTIGVNGGSLKLSATGALTNAANLYALGTGTLDVSAASITLGQYRTQTLAGTGTVQGNVSCATAGNIAPGVAYIYGTPYANIAPGTLTINGSLTLNGSTNIAKLYTPGVVGSGVNDLLQINGGLNVPDFTTATILVSANSAPQPGIYRIMNYTGSRTGSGTFIAVASLNATPGLTYTVDETTPGQVNVIVGGSAQNLVWYGGQSANAWDVASTPNWNVNANVFYGLDAVTFNDSSITQYVNITVPVTPSIVTVSSASNYLFGGASKITGGASLIKSGTGTLTLTNRHDYVGTTTINGGALGLGIGGGAGTLQGGGAVTVNANGTLLSLVGDSFGYTLGTKINTLNINGGTFNHSATANVSMWGVAITMTGGSMYATNGSSCRLDIGTGGGSMPNSTFTTLASANSATVYGYFYDRQSILTNTVADGPVADDLLFNGRLASSAVGNIWVKQGLGTLALRTTADNSSLSLRVDQGTVVLGATVANGCANLTLNGGTVRFEGISNGQIWDGGTVTMYSGTLNMNGKDEAINILAGTNGVIRNDAASTTSTLTIGASNGNSTFGSLFQDGTGKLAFTKSGTGTVTLTNVNAYTGNTLVSGGTLALTAPASLAGSPTIQVNAGTVLNVTNLAASKLTVSGAQTLIASSCTVVGSVDVNGTLVVLTNAIRTPIITGSLTLTGTTYMEVDKTGGLTNSDLVTVSNTVTYGGTLVVTGLGGAYAPGDTFKLFSAGNYSGSFSTINLPANVVWDTTQLGVNGTIRVVSVPRPVITSVASLGLGGFQLGFSGPAGNTYRVWATNDVAAPLTNWPAIYTNLFGPSGTATLIDTAATNYSRRFYDITVP